MELKKGYHRRVLLIGKYAIKFARSNYSRKCNIGERYFTLMLPDGGEGLIAPTICLLFGGWIGVQRRCGPRLMTPTENEMVSDLNKRMSGFNIPLDSFPENIGWLDEKLVYLDYCS